MNPLVWHGDVTCYLFQDDLFNKETQYSFCKHFNGGLRDAFAVLSAPTKPFQWCRQNYHTNYSEIRTAFTFTLERMTTQGFDKKRQVI